MAVNKSRAEIPTIDVNLVTIETDEGEFGFDTANEIEVEVQTEDEAAARLVVKGILRAQKPPMSTITGHEITLHDNVFNPQLVKVLQGGTIKYWANPERTKTTTEPTNYGVAGYAPPVVGSAEKGKVFKLNAYSAIYTPAGVIKGYEKTTYPNCQGQPVAFNSEDGAFRAPEYVITSAPDTGEPPYDINYVDELPQLLDPESVVYIMALTTGTYLDKTPEEIGEVEVVNNNSIVGTSNFIEDFEDFNPSNPKEQEGYYLLVGGIPAGVIARVDRSTGKGKQVTINDGWFMVWLGGTPEEVATVQHLVFIKNNEENKYGVRVQLVDD